MARHAVKALSIATQPRENGDEVVSSLVNLLSHSVKGDWLAGANEL